MRSNCKAMLVLGSLLFALLCRPAGEDACDALK